MAKSTPNTTAESTVSMDIDNHPVTSTVTTATTKAVKRKASKNEESDSDSNDETSDVEMLDVEFDFFDPQTIDYHSIKLLLQQLLSHDAKLIDTSAITNLILDQKLVGSTVKTDGATGDPYAILTVLNLNIHKEHEAIKALLAYILSKSLTSPTLHSHLTNLFSASSDPQSSTSSKPIHVGLVISERLVNMPAQVVPPMYNMLVEELQWARDESEPYHFSHLLFLSRVFLSSADELEEDPNAALNDDNFNGTEKSTTLGGKGKKNKNKKQKGGNHVGSEGKSTEQVWMYHPEDEFIARSGIETLVFPFTSSPARTKAVGEDSFGVETKGQLILLEMNQFEKLVIGMEGFLGGME